MSYADDLLKQAESLCSSGARKPAQVNLRRAISAAYYALFHQLTEVAAAHRLPSRLPHLRAQLRRKFQHKVMKNVAKATSESKPPPPAQLAFVADALVILQEARHEADYDFSRSFAKAEATDHIGRAKAALVQLVQAADTPDGERFLLELLVGRLDG